MEIDELCDRGTRAAAEGRLSDAEAMLLRVLTQQPDHAVARYNLGHILLAQGRYAEAGPYHRQRATHLVSGRQKPNLPYREWRGEPLAGKQLLVFLEQGFGDEIMLARFARHFAERGASVTLLCTPPLARLFQRSLPVQVVAASGKVDFPDPDFWTMSGDFLTEGGFTPETLPSSPYLFAQPQSQGGIGVKVRGSPSHTNDGQRSLPDTLAAELLALPGAVDLDPAKTGATDFQETAEIVAGLDLVVSVDTSIAHLAGALGKPVWILLPFIRTDWRWMRGRSDSPWYPTARLFRQPSPGDWRAALDEVRAALRDSIPYMSEVNGGRFSNG